MKKFIIAILAVLAVCCVMGAIGCGGKSDWKCKAVVISSEDFYANQDDLLSGNSSVLTDTVTSAEISSLAIGKEYFFVLAARGYTDDLYYPTTSLTIECDGIEYTNFSDTSGDGSIFSLDDGFADSNIENDSEYMWSGGVSYHPDEVFGRGITEFDIDWVTPYTDTLTYYIAIGFKVNSECDFAATYDAGGYNCARETVVISGKEHIKYTSAKNSISSEAGEQTKSLSALYDKQVKVNTLSVGYIQSGYYNYGNFDESYLQDTVSLSSGENVYMVIDFEMQGVYDNVDNDKITLEVAISPSKYCLGRLQDANTSTTTDETVVNGVSIVNATYSVPENGNTRTERIIIRIEARVTGDVLLSVYFYNHDVGISATGNAKYSGALTVSGQTAGLDYQLNEDGQSYTVTGLNSSVTSIDIPYYYNGCPVTAIAEGAFAGCSKLKSITIPDSVTNIGEGAFEGCDSLLSLYVPDSVAVYSGILSGCIALTSLTISFTDEDQFLDDFFGGSTPQSLETVTVESSFIPEYAFLNCSILKTVDISNVTEIPYRAFSGCSSLANVDIPDGVTYIYGYAFSGCSSLVKITIPDSVTYIDGSAFGGCGIVSLDIPDSVTEIGDYAFAYCTSLVSVTIGKGVTSIGDRAFYECYKVIEVYNYSSVTLSDGNYGDCLGYYAQNIYTDGTESNLIFTGDYVLYYYDLAESYYLAAYMGTDTDIVLPDKIGGHEYDIYSMAFYGCTNITSIVIPDCITYIDEYAFYGCTSLESVTFGSGLSGIGSYAFYGCTSLAEITIPANVHAIYYYAFYDCPLTSVTFENTEGWVVLWIYGSDLKRTDIDVTDESVMADILSESSYYGYRAYLMCN